MIIVSTDMDLIIKPVVIPVPPLRQNNTNDNNNVETCIHPVLLLVDPVLVETPAPRGHPQRLLLQHQQVVPVLKKGSTKDTIAGGLVHTPSLS